MRLLLGFALAFTVAANRASADDPPPSAAGTTRLSAPLGPPDETARPTFEAGRRAFEAGRYAEALDAFQRVFVLTGHPAMLVNIANAHARLGENRRAAASLEQYLAMMPDVGDRSLLEARIAALYRQGDTLTLPPAPPPPPPAPAAAPPPPPAAAAPPPTGFIAGRTFTWVALGTSIAFAGAAGLVWLDANQNFERLALTCGVDGRCSDAQLEPISESVTATNLCLAASALSLGAAIVLFVVEGGDAAERVPARVAAGFDGRNALLSVSGRL